MVYRVAPSWQAACAIGLLAFVINPAFACVSDPEFQYGDQEMREAVEGSWDATLSYTDGRQAAFRLSLIQASRTTQASGHGLPGTRSVVRVAEACANREFVKTANACISSSTMPLDIAFLSGDAAYSTALTSAVLIVDSLRFDAGDLLISIGDERLSARLLPDGTAMNAVITTRTSGLTETIGTGTLSRASSLSDSPSIR